MTALVLWVIGGLIWVLLAAAFAIELFDSGPKRYTFGGWVTLVALSLIVGPPLQVVRKLLT